MRPPRGGGVPRPAYKLKDTLGEDIKGDCYPEAIQRIREAAADIIEAERVLRHRRVGKQSEYLLKFKGSPHKLIGWITKSELERYKNHFGCNNTNNGRRQLNSSVAE
jgi:hypothetical protein